MLANLFLAGPLVYLVREKYTNACVDGCVSQWKIGFAFILLVEGLLFGNLVYLIKRVSSSWKKFDAAVHFGNAVSGGVLFATAMLHILPQTAELFASGDAQVPVGNQTRINEQRGTNDFYLTGNPNSEGQHYARFPWAYLILMLSFYVVFFVEKILIPRLLRSDYEFTCRTCGCDFWNEESIDSTAWGRSNEPPSLRRWGWERSFDGMVPVNDESDSQTGKGFASAEFFVGLTDIIGISVHSLFESIALGLSPHFSLALNIFIASVSHRWATSTAISFRLARDLPYVPFLVLISVFSATVPVGVGIGTALSSLSDTVQGVMFGISCGTFVYTGAFQSLAEEFVRHPKWHFRKFLATLCGVSLVATITAILVATGVRF